MTNYLLSIDPSIKNTGFTLGENKKPILIESYSFNKKSKTNFIITNNFNDFINDFIYSMVTAKKDTFLQENDIKNVLNELTLIIERGTFHSKNGIGYETQEHLRGFIAGQFNKLLTKNMLISPSSGKKGYVNKYVKPYGEINHIGLEEKLKYQNKKTKGNKLLSLLTAKHLIKENNGNITISNHDEADSLLIGGYYLNKENK